MKMIYMRFFGILMLLSSCEEKKDGIACEDNPTENIGWIKDLIEEQHLIDCDSCSLEIVQYNYNGNSVFSVDNCVDCSDALIEVYDCEQNLICEFGGVTGLNTCPDFEAEAQFVSLLFSTSETGSELCEKAVIVNEDLYMSKTASPIENIEVTGNCLNIIHLVCEGEDYIDQVNLLDAGWVLESYPVQRSLKFYNSTDYSATFCERVEVTTSFDISALATWDEPNVILNIEGYSEQVIYARMPKCGDPNINCVDIQEVDAKKLEYMLNEIEVIAASVVCENPDDWKITPIGSKACGGPQGFLAYSNTLDEVAFLEKVAAYKVTVDEYNEKWEVFSTCDVPVMPSSIICENGKPSFVYD